MNFVPLIAIFLIFYFLLIRPQQKQMQNHDKMLKNLKKGDHILTNGGLYGVITAVKGADLEVKISEEVKVLLAKSGVAKRLEETPALTQNGVASTQG
ncbi:MAG: preprotein translocase subunit YajC [Elusimicrobia bacterium]|nr:preprotein translocase subunit YajC [Elusimicrobiota bacterium]